MSQPYYLKIRVREFKVNEFLNNANSVGAYVLSNNEDTTVILHGGVLQFYYDAQLNEWVIHVYGNIHSLVALLYEYINASNTYVSVEPIMQCGNYCCDE